MSATPPPADSPTGSDSRHEDFLRLLTKCQRQLYVYVMSMVHDWAAADDVIQETNLALWRKFDSYTPGSNFAAWAVVVAHHRVLRYRRQQSRDRHVFSDRFEEMALNASHEVPDLDLRRDALARCLDKLPPTDRSMIEQCYEGGIKATAAAVGRSTHVVYRTVSRIRDRLHECITMTLRTETGT